MASCCCLYSPSRCCLSTDSLKLWNQKSSFMSLPEDSGVWTSVLCRMELWWAWICWSTLGSGIRAAPKVKDSTGVVEDPARVVEVSLTMFNLAFFGRLFFGRWCWTFGRVGCLSMLLLTWWKHTDVPVNYRQHQPGVSLIFFFLSQVTHNLYGPYMAAAPPLCPYLNTA